MGQSVKRYVSDQFERTVNNLLLIKYCIVRAENNVIFL